MSKEKEIRIPLNIVDALLAAIANKDHAATQNIGADVRRIAEDQAKDHFKTHRHP